MRLSLSTLFVALVLLLGATPVLAGGATLQGSGPKPAPGSPLVDFTLPAAANTENAAYLGVPEGTPFTLSSIQADALLIEIFSMYCPYCQKEAPVVNELFDKLRASDMKDRLKMIGLGTGNSEFEVNKFREKFSVEMPLFPDGDYAIYNSIGTVGTPFFILATVNRESGALEIAAVQEGLLDDPEAFFKSMLDTVRGLPTGN